MIKSRGRLSIFLGAAIICFGCLIAVRAADGNNPAAPPHPFDYAKPALLTGTVYAIGSDHTNVLFNFRRSATRTGNTVQVKRLFTSPDGRVAAIENVVYESRRLVSYGMTDPPAGVWGTVQIVPDPDHPGLQKLLINHGHAGVAGENGVERNLPKDLLVDDTVYPFMLAHWSELAAGASVKFSMVSLERERAFAFVLRKTRESVAEGKPVAWFKMAPASLIVAHFLNPISLCVELDPPHRILEYIGRTTPRIRKDGSWKFLDADTVFDWD